MKMVAVVFPTGIYIALVVAGFSLTERGWSLFWASLIAYFVFAVRPRMNEW